MHRVISAAVMTLTLISSAAALAQNSPSGGNAYAAGTDARLTLGRNGLDEDFLENDMNFVSAEIEWSKIAATKGTNQDVKALANETVTEDLPVASRLVSEAKAAKLKVPDGLSGKYKKESEKLNSLSGDAFDKEYVSALIKVQHDDVGALRDEAKSTKNASLQTFAEKTGTQVTDRNDSAKMLDKMLAAK